MTDYRNAFGRSACGWNTFLVICLAWLLGAAPALAVEVNKVRLWRAPDHTRLVFDLDSPVEHNLFSLENPKRLVLDFKSTRLEAGLQGLDLAQTPVASIRTGIRQGHNLRVVLELRQAVRPRSFRLKPNKQYGHRLVVDLYTEAKPREKTVEDAFDRKQAVKGRDVIIALDAGHGGEDPGAIGPGGVQEKDLVLAIARKLHAKLKAEPGFKPVMIRKSDYYVPLRKRTLLARKAGADLFISIHADAFRDARARGASVWTLSERGASGELGRWLADQENSADLIGGVGTISLNDKDDTLAGVLLDMSMNKMIGNSREVGQSLLGRMGRVAHLHKEHVEKAAFVVLKSPDIPSVLVETGFISNPGEARLLQSRRHQERLAEALFQGVKHYFQRKPPVMTWLAQQRARNERRSYRVSRGDTLSVIANRQGVSLDRLREINDLENDLIRVGQVLRIPAS